MSETRRSRVKSVDTAFDIIQYLHDADSATLDEVAKAVDVSRSTAHRHLSTIHDRGYVVLDDGEYSLSLRFLTHGGQRRDALAATEVIEEKVRQLSEETAERVQFITEEHGERVYVYTYAGSDAVRTDATIGKRGPLRVSAAGKAILANLPADRRDEILAQRPDRATENTITSEDELRTELAEIRERGYAFNEEESTSGLRAVGVPVHCSEGNVLGAISLSGPANRLIGEYFRTEIPDLLLGAVNEVELNLQYL